MSASHKGGWEKKYSFVDAFTTVILIAVQEKNKNINNAKLLITVNELSLKCKKQTRAGQHQCTRKWLIIKGYKSFLWDGNRQEYMYVLTCSLLLKECVVYVLN